MAIRAAEICLKHLIPFRLSVPMQKKFQKPDFVVSLYRLKVMGKGLGVMIHLLLFLDHAGKGVSVTVKG